MSGEIKNLQVIEDFFECKVQNKHSVFLYFYFRFCYNGGRV